MRASYNAPAGYLAEVGERHPPLSATPEILANCSLTVRAVVERGPVQIADVEAAPLYRSRELLCDGDTVRSLWCPSFTTTGSSVP